MILNNIKRELVNIQGWKTTRKIVVIESDDWGSLRMNHQALNFIKKSNETKLLNHYDTYDCIERIDDLDKLFEVLLSVKNNSGKNPIITANTVVFNPDFEKIENDKFLYFHKESILKSYSKYSSDRIISIIGKGIEEKIFKPQFHGGLHLNQKLFEKLLIEENSIVRNLAKFKAFGPTRKHERSELGYGILSTYGYETMAEQKCQLESIEESINEFYRIFNYLPNSFIAPQNTIYESLILKMKEYGIDTIQGSRIHKTPNIDKKSILSESHIIGQTNERGQVFLVRNSTFEPSYGNINWVDKCFEEIKSSFRWRRPAIICSHRVNYMGFIDPINRDKNLKLLKILLDKIVVKWPDVEFITSDELGDIILKSKNEMYV